MAKKKNMQNSLFEWAYTNRKAGSKTADAVLAEDGTVEFKTDNRDLFDFSVEEVKEAGWKLLACTYDLHHDEELSRGNVMTEYEEKFSSMGNPIHKLVTAR